MFINHSRNVSRSERTWSTAKRYSRWKGRRQSRSGVARTSRRSLVRLADDTCSENAPATPSVVSWGCC